MNTVRWLSSEDVAKTGVCCLEVATKLVEQTFRLYENGQATIVPETALRLCPAQAEEACYILPAHVGGDMDVSGVKWSVHGHGEEGLASRIQTTVVLNQSGRGVPLAVMNGTSIGAIRTGAVTAVALSRLAPKHTRKVAICGAGGQGEIQLQAVLHALPQVEEISIWGRTIAKAHVLAQRYQNQANITVAQTLEQALDHADVVIGATSAAQPYLTKEGLAQTALYCHIGFHEIDLEAIRAFSTIIVDTWEDGKTMSGQSLYRYYREGSFRESDVTGTLGALLCETKAIAPATVAQKVMFDAFGLPIFDLAIAHQVLKQAEQMKLGTVLPW